MTAPTEYFSTDANAPVARGERRSLHDILYACLCTGYGSKAGAGWTREFVNATFDKAAWRPNPTGGCGFFLQTDGTVAGGATNAYHQVINAYETMSSVDTGLFPALAASVVGMTTAQAAGTTARPWYLVADDKFFYLFIWVGITGTPGLTDVSVAVLAFGDGIKKDQNDGSCCFLLYSTGTGGGPLGYVYTSGSGAMTSQNAVWSTRSMSGVAGPRGQALTRGGGPGPDAGVCGLTGPTYAAGDDFMYTRPHVNNALANTIRGFIPGFYYPCHSNPFTAQLGALSVGAKTFRTIKCNALGGGGIGSLMIDLADWRV